MLAMTPPATIRARKALPDGGGPGWCLVALGDDEYRVNDYPDNQRRPCEKLIERRGGDRRVHPLLASITKVLGVDFRVLLVLGRDVGICVDRFDGAGRDARAAIDAYFGIDEQHLVVIFSVDAVDRTNVDTRLVFGADTWFGDDVRH
jgi:hypothetical protein